LDADDKIGGERFETGKACTRSRSWVAGAGGAAAVAELRPRVTRSGSGPLAGRRSRRFRSRAASPTMASWAAASRARQTDHPATCARPIEAADMILVCLPTFRPCRHARALAQARTTIPVVLIPRPHRLVRWSPGRSFTRSARSRRRSRNFPRSTYVGAQIRARPRDDHRLLRGACGCGLAGRRARAIGGPSTGLACAKKSCRRSGVDLAM